MTTIAEYRSLIIKLRDKTTSRKVEWKATYDPSSFAR